MENGWSKYLIPVYGKWLVKILDTRFPCSSVFAEAERIRNVTACRASPQKIAINFSWRQKTMSRLNKPARPHEKSPD
jgi:hypothetical protein